MTVAQQQYKDTVNRIAFSLLLFLALSFMQGTVLSFLPYFTASLSPLAAEILQELLGGILYAVSFCLPVLFFKLISTRTAPEPMFLELSLPRETPLYIFFGIALVSAAASLNAVMVNIFDYSEFSEEVLWDSTVTSNYQLILLFFTMAIVPAFVEEFLFRGMVLGNLLPYGRTTAILASALLFGLMHQNAEQFFYATAAGLVIGWVYVSTRSIWPCVLLHLVNNFRSVWQTAITQRLPSATANVVLYVGEALVLILGLVSGILLFLRERDHRAAMLQSGAFEVDLPADAEYAERALSAKQRVRGFFTVPMIVFCVICVLTMLSLVGMALLFY